MNKIVRIDIKATGSRIRELRLLNKLFKTTIEDIIIEMDIGA